MLNPTIEQRINEMAEHTATLQGKTKKDYQLYCIKTIKSLCGDPVNDCSEGLKLYWRVYEYEMFNKGVIDPKRE